jgi:hypothetical protein
MAAARPFPPGLDWKIGEWVRELSAQRFATGGKLVQGGENLPFRGTIGLLAHEIYVFAAQPKR